jgi:hypothetical protein
MKKNIYHVFDHFLISHKIYKSMEEEETNIEDKQSRLLVFCIPNC